MDRIDSIAVYRVGMPLVYPFRTAFGDDSTIESVLVRLGAGSLYGWGEGAPWRYPAYSPECAATAFVMVKDFLAKLLLGQEINTGEELQRRFSFIRGNYFAKAALDMAWWDCYAKSCQMPLWKVLGGMDGTVSVGADFGVMENVEELIEAIGRAVGAGYQRVKLKYRPGWELQMVSEVRNAFPELIIHVDCNGAYTLDDVPMLKMLDRYNLAMIEQPLMFDDLIHHAELQKQIETPICLDESITSVEKAQKAINIKACRWINIKPGRVGGVTNAIAIHDLCEQSGIPCWIGGMLESAVGASHCMALATLSNIKYPSDIFPSERFYERDLSRPPMVMSSPSRMSASEAAGIGAEPDPTLLERYLIENTILNLAG